MLQQQSEMPATTVGWDLRHPGLIMKDGTREVHEFMGMWPLKPDADLMKLSHTLAFREHWKPPVMTFAEATTMLGLIRAARWFVGTSTEFGPTLYFVSQFDSSLDKYFDDFVLNGRENLEAIWGQCIGCPTGPDATSCSTLHAARSRPLPATTPSPVYRPLYEAGFDANLSFYDGLDGQIAWEPDAEGCHPLRSLFIDDFLILDLAYGFAPDGFLSIERALLDGRAHDRAGGRWLDDDILDDLLTLIVSGLRGERFGDGVGAPTKPGRLTFPYVREPNNRDDIPPCTELRNVRCAGTYARSAREV